MKTRLILFTILLSSLLACHPKKVTTSSTNTGNIPLRAIEQPDPALVDANNQFALELYQQLSSYDKNVFLSPYSVTTALAMTYAGARSETEAQMSKVLHFDRDQDAFHLKMRDLIAYMSGLNKADSIEFSTAQSFFAQRDFRFLDSYITLLKQQYQSGMQLVDFKNELEKSRLLINDWVAKKTHDRIQNLIPQGMINQLARLVLVNAIYFKGSWSVAFDEKLTTPRSFFLPDGKSIQVPFMSKENTMFNYVSNDELQMAELPYADSSMSMLVILPARNVSFSALEQKMTSTVYNEWIRSLKPEIINLMMPKFSTTTDFELSDVLKKMGMPLAFSLQADFSGMDGKKDLMIDKVIHKAFVEVSEKGTEAAAATAVVIRQKTTILRPGLILNRPFMIILKENKYNSILFMGRINNPSETK